MKIRAIIIDDELLSLQSTELLVRKYCPQVEIAALTQSPEEGLQLINQIEPELLFLDIAMPEMNGFEMLQHLTFRDFEIIFTTAYDDYAIQAFKVNAIDYLLKPIDPRELMQAVQKVTEKLQKNQRYHRIDEILRLMGVSEIASKRIALWVDGRIQMIPFDEIIYCESESNYSNIFLTDNRKLMLSKTLKELETLLNRPQFFRCQNSYLVNLDHIREYFRGEGGDLLMSNGKTIRVSRHKKEALLRLLTK